MPTLDWLDRQAAFQVAAHTPTHVLRPHAAGHIYGDAASARDNLLIQGEAPRVSRRPVGLSQTAAA
jgi:hypothetical protein